MTYSQFWQSVLVLAFAAAIIFIGAEELRRRYAPSVRAKSPGQLVRELHGDVDLDKRAGLKRAKIQERAAAAEDQDDEAQGDLLGRSDRRELNQLLEKLVP